MTPVCPAGSTRVHDSALTHVERRVDKRHFFWCCDLKKWNINNYKANAASIGAWHQVIFTLWRQGEPVCCVWVQMLKLKMESGGWASPDPAMLPSDRLSGSPERLIDSGSESVKESSVSCWLSILLHIHWYQPSIIRAPGKQALPMKIE